MTGTSAIDLSGFNRNLGLAADNLGIRNDPTEELRNSFARMMEENSRREQDTAILDSPTGSSADQAPRLSTVSFSAVPIIPSDPTIDKTSELYQQCLALEGFLVKNIFNAMRKNVLKDSLIDTGFAGEIYEDMLWDEYAKIYTENAGFGLADLAYLELTGQRGRRI